MPTESRYDLKKIIIVGVVILIVAGLIGFYFINKKNKADEAAQQGKNLFPFGQGSPTTPNSAVAPGNATIENIGANPLTVNDGERLRHVTDYPITGFLPTILNRVVSEPKLDEKTRQMKLVSLILPVNMVRFNAKQNGYLIDGEISRDAIIIQQKTKTSVPIAEELWFGSQGNAVTYRTWNNTTRNIESFTGIIPTPPQLAYCSVPLTADLKTGSKGDQVKELQKYLREKLSITITIDGSYGSKTSTLIKTIQQRFGLPETGTVDAATREAINADCATIQASFDKQFEGPLTINGSFLPTNILRGTISPDGTKMFYLRETADGTVGIVAKSDGSSPQQVFVSPLSEWQPNWVNTDVITMTTLASREADGYLYFLNPTTGVFKKILGPVRGLTTLTSPDAKTVLYSGSTDRGIVTRLYNVEAGTASVLDLVTLPEKCTWKDTAIIICGIPKTISSDQYPDAWYQGLLSFKDTLWSIDTKQGTTNVVLSPSEDIDAIKLKVSPDGSYLYFVDKNDETLWSYRLAE
jgi:peptidoglycan hydrolase-like protein with peptidoglycan-binding domain